MGITSRVLCDLAGRRNAGAVASVPESSLPSTLPLCSPAWPLHVCADVVPQASCIAAVPRQCGSYGGAGRRLAAAAGTPRRRLASWSCAPAVTPSWSPTRGAREPLCCPPCPRFPAGYTRCPAARPSRHSALPAGSSAEASSSVGRQQYCCPSLPRVTQGCPTQCAHPPMHSPPIVHTEASPGCRRIRKTPDSTGASCAAAQVRLHRARLHARNSRRFMVEGCIGSRQRQACKRPPHPRCWCGHGCAPRAAGGHSWHRWLLQGADSVRLGSCRRGRHRQARHVQCLQGPRILLRVRRGVPVPSACLHASLQTGLEEVSVLQHTCLAVGPGFPVCSACSCIWRFTRDDVAAAQHGAAWECILCRPPPKLHLAYIEEQAGSRSPRGAPCSGSSGCEADAERAAAVAAGLRRSTRQRSAARPQQQQQRAAGSESDSSIIVLLTDSEAGELTDAESAEEVRPARVRSHGRRQPPGSARRPAGAAQQAAGTAPRRQLAASNTEAATPAELAGSAAQHPAGEIQLGAAQQAGRTGRKRHRRLLPQRDIQSPTVDEEAQHMRRMQQQRQQRQQQLGAGRSQLQALQRSQRQSQEDRLRKLLL